MGGTSGALIRQAERRQRAKTQSAAHSVTQGEAVQTNSYGHGEELLQLSAASRLLLPDY